MLYLTKINGKWDAKSQEALDNCKNGSWKLDNSKKRSNEQNKYYYGAVIPLMTKFWNDNKQEGTPTLTPDDIHDWIQAKGYWGYKVIGKQSIPRRSSECNTMDFAAGINNLQQDMAKYGLDIPSPNEQDYRLNPEDK